MIRTALLLALLHLVHSEVLPDDFQHCHLNDPDISKCMKSAVQDALQRIGNKGIPSLGLPPLEPLDVKEIKVDKGRRGPVSLKLQFTNLKIYGIPESTIKSFDARLNQYDFQNDVLTPVFRFDADYTMDGQILVLPVKGKGRCNITLVGLTTNVDVHGNPVEQNGETYMVLDRFDIKLHPKRLYSDFTNLFNGDKRLGETMNTFMNENWEVIFSELRSSLEKAFGAVFLDYSNILFKKVPFKNIFL